MQEAAALQRRVDALEERINQLGQPKAAPSKLTHRAALAASFQKK
jgi:hypothetical protein